MKFLSYLVVICAVLVISVAFASPVEADYGAYGQEQTSGVKKEEINITEVNTGLDDINPTLIGAGFLAVSGVLYAKSRKSSHTS